MNTNQSNPDPEWILVLLQEGIFDGSEFVSTIVRATGPQEAYEKALSSDVGADYPNAVYCHTAANFRFDIAELKQKLAATPAMQGYWCLVQDQSDNTFQRVNITAANWSAAAEAAVAYRKNELELTDQDDCGFKVVMTLGLRDVEYMLARLLAP